MESRLKRVGRPLTGGRLSVPYYFASGIRCETPAEQIPTPLVIIVCEGTIEERLAVDIAVGHDGILNVGA